MNTRRREGRRVMCQQDHALPSQRRRRGAATLEFAVCFPVIFLIAMGAIEAASLTFLRQALVQSAYETAKGTVRIGGTEAKGRTRGAQVLSARRITGTTVTFNPSNPDGAARGTPITVTVAAPGDANTVFPFGPFSGQQLSVQATMLKEE